MKTILIVEDEQGLLRVLKDKLEEEGFSVLIARNGLEGLNISMEKHPDLILLDILMPVMDGITMLKRLRQDVWGKDVSVMLLTNLSQEEKIADAVELGTFEYLIKSDWSIADVVKKIKEKLKI
jgi:two-component system alkaline phosphatase synthesis response regulator PhoP